MALQTSRIGKMSPLAFICSFPIDHNFSGSRNINFSPQNEDDMVLGEHLQHAQRCERDSQSSKFDITSNSSSIHTSQNLNIVNGSGDMNFLTHKVHERSLKLTLMPTMKITAPDLSGGSPKPGPQYLVVSVEASGTRIINNCLTIPKNKVRIRVTSLKVCITLHILHNAPPPRSFVPLHKNNVTLFGMFIESDLDVNSTSRISLVLVMLASQDNILKPFVKSKYLADSETNFDIRDYSLSHKGMLSTLSDQLTTTASYLTRTPNGTLTFGHILDITTIKCSAWGGSGMALWTSGRDWEIPNVSLPRCATVAYLHPLCEMLEIPTTQASLSPAISNQPPSSNSTPSPPPPGYYIGHTVTTCDSNNSPSHFPSADANGATVTQNIRVGSSPSSPWTVRNEGGPSSPRTVRMNDDTSSPRTVRVPQNSQNSQNLLDLRNARSGDDLRGPPTLPDTSSPRTVRVPQNSQNSLNFLDLQDARSGDDLRGPLTLPTPNETPTAGKELLPLHSMHLNNNAQYATGIPDEIFDTSHLEDWATWSGHDPPRITVWSFAKDDQILGRVRQQQTADAAGPPDCDRGAASRHPPNHNSNDNCIDKGNPRWGRRGRGGW
jgi:hypothetical protein